MRTASTPVADRRIALTRPAGQNESLRERLAALGAQVLETPLTAIAPGPDLARLEAALRDLAAYAWIVVTSANGARALADCLPARDLSSARSRQPRVAAVGPATAEGLRAAGLTAGVVPPRYNAEGLLEVLRPLVDPGSRVLLLQAAEARPVLAEGLRGLGAVVDALAVYRAVPSEEGAAALRAALSGGSLDAVVLTSGATARAMAALVPAAGRPKVVCLGPVTAAAAAGAGLQVDLVAPEATAAGVVAALAQLFAGEERLTGEERPTIEERLTAEEEDG